MVAVDAAEACPAKVTIQVCDVPVPIEEEQVISVGEFTTQPLAAKVAACRLPEASAAREGLEYVAPTTALRPLGPKFVPVMTTLSPPPVDKDNMPTVAEMPLMVGAA